MTLSMTPDEWRQAASSQIERIEQEMKGLLQRQDILGEAVMGLTTHLDEPEQLEQAIGADLRDLRDRLHRLETAVTDQLVPVEQEQCPDRPEWNAGPHCFHAHPFLGEIPLLCCWCETIPLGELSHGPYRPEP